MRSIVEYWLSTSRDGIHYHEPVKGLCEVGIIDDSVRFLLDMQGTNTATCRVIVMIEGKTYRFSREDGSMYLYDIFGYDFMNCSEARYREMLEVVKQAVQGKRFYTRGKYLTVEYFDVVHVPKPNPTWWERITGRETVINAGL